MKRDLRKSSLKFWVATVGVVFVGLASFAPSVEAQTNTLPTSGNVGIGTTTPNVELHVSTESVAFPRGIISAHHSTDGSGAMFNFWKSRGTRAAPTAIANGDNMGSLYAHGYDGTSYGSGARIRFSIDGTVSTGSVPGSFQIFTGSSGGGIERMRINSAGNVGIGTTSPSAKLQIMSSIPTIGEGLFKLQNSAGSTLISMGDDTLATYRGQLSIYGKQSGADYERLRIWHTGDNNDAIVFASEAGGTGTLRNIRFSAPTTMFSGILNANAVQATSATGAANFISFWETNVAFNGAIGFAAGSPNMQFQTGGSGILNGTTRMTILNTGNVGIGKPAPAYPLDVNGEINATGFRINGTPLATGSSQWTTATSGPNIYFNTGNVGIGSPDPQSNLQIGTVASAPTATPVRLSLGGTYSSSAGANFKLRLYDDGTVANIFGIGVSSGSMDFGVSSTGGYNWYSGGAHKLALTGTGNVGIGTTTPVFDGNAAAKYLTLNAGSGGVGSIGAAGGTASNSTGVGQVAFVNSGLGTAEKRLATIVGSTDTATNSGMLDFYTAAAGVFPSPRMRITSGGKVGIGLTTPLYSLDINGGINGFRAKAATVSSNDIIGSFENANGVQAVVRGDGNFGIGTATPTGKLHVADGNHVSVYTSPGYAGTFAKDGLTVNSNPDVGYSSMAIFSGHNPVTDRGLFRIRRSDGSTTTEALYVRMDGYVGIGTTTPLHKLDVNGTINATGITVNGAALAGSQWTGTTSINYAAGNVGIGIATPNQKFSVVGTAAFYNTTPVTPSGVRGLFMGNFPGGSSIWSYNYVAGTGDSLALSGQDINFNTYQGLSSISRLFVSSAGNVGIGTVNPGSNYKLDVNGNANVTGNINVTGTGDINASGTITGATINAKYQDIAEWVGSSQSLSAGTVVVLDQTKSNQVIASSQAYDTRVAGVISLQPGLTLGESGAGKVLVATTGRVKIKVDATTGPIEIGDLLVTSDKEGVAKKSEPLSLGGVAIHRPGTLIGKALEPLVKGTGEILVLLSLQ